MGSAHVREKGRAGGGGGGELRLGEIELARVVSGSGWTGRGEGGNPVEEGGEGWHGREREGRETGRREEMTEGVGEDGRG